ncbi:hypothetical protein COMA2_130143 [Candidatus Nitrospira nitrificans]|uniref:Uncharacterized protein n=1 Tax=Candidatus Nitrospira nitrificans TaxID=1742973 RepID=A0A0S4L7T9_9BACT|nr:hypothetical protein COMA2_130143 [Candidatus Nitrospira nitrificans]
MFKNNLANSSIQVTMDIYSHLFPGGGQEWVHKFGDLLTPNAPQAHPDTSGVQDRMHKLGGEVLDSEGKDLVPPIRIERTTRGLGNRCSIQLSYGGVAELYRTDGQIGRGGIPFLGAHSYPQHPPAKTCRWR